MMGHNVLTLQGDRWRLHRRVVTPAFSNETYVFCSFTANTSVLILVPGTSTSGRSRALCTTRCWILRSGGLETTTSSHHQQVYHQGVCFILPTVAFLCSTCLKLALLVIAACGFNMRLQWNEEGSSDGLASPIDNAVGTVSSTIVERLTFPEWIFRLYFGG